jgi:hypothetical protein
MPSSSCFIRVKSLMHGKPQDLSEQVISLIINPTVLSRNPESDKGEGQ